MRWQWLEPRATVLPGTRRSLFLLSAAKQDNTVEVMAVNKQIKHKNKINVHARASITLFSAVRVPLHFSSCFSTILFSNRSPTGSFCPLWYSPPPAASLFEFECQHFSTFTVLGFLCSTADAYVVSTR